MNPLKSVLIFALALLIPTMVGAQQGFPHGDLVRASDFENACSQTVRTADEMCRRAISMALGAEPIIEETRTPDGKIQHVSRMPEPDASKVGWFGEEACANQHWASCMLYTMLLEKGQVVPQDKPRADALTQVACRGSHALACSALKEAGVPLDPNATIPPRPSWVKKPKIASAMDNTPPPVPPGAQQQTPDPTLILPPPQRASLDDPTLADDPIETGMIERCRNGSAGECYRLARGYGTGQGLPLDAERARHYYAKACELGSAQGCERIGMTMPQRARDAIAQRRTASLLPVAGVAFAGVLAVGAVMVFARRRSAEPRSGGPRPVARPPTGPRPDRRA